MRLIRTLAAAVALVGALTSFAWGQTITPGVIPGCIYLATPPTLTDKQQSPLLCDVNGKLNVTPTAALPGGSTLQLQYNNAGAFGGMAGTSWNDTNRSLTITGATLTGASSPLLALSQTWNNAATLFTGYEFSITNTASNAASLVQNIRVGGLSIFAVRVDGFVTALSGYRVLGNAGTISLRNGFTVLTSPATAQLNLGNLDAAVPVPQTVSAQGVVAGTADTAGASWTQQGSLSTGSGIGGSIVFKTSAANAASATQNTGVTVLTLMGSATTTANPGRILAAGQIESSGSQPTAAGSGGACTTGAIAGGANAGTITLTAACAATNTITLTFKTASATGWACFANDRGSATTLLNETTTTTTTAVLTVTGIASGATDVIQYACTGY